MTEEGRTGGKGTGPAAPERWPLITALAVAAAVAIGVYMFVEAGSGGAVGYTLLIVLPAALSAFVAWVATVRRDWPRSSFLLVPVWIAGGAAMIGGLLFREGVICILMILPLWVALGMLGTWPVYLYRKGRGRADSSIFRANALLLLPFLALLIDGHVEPPRETYVVTRAIVVDAPAADAWRLLLAVPAIGADEGRWTVSQNLLRLPRPTDATLAGHGVGAVRHARWQGGIRFQEIVTQWQPDRALAWRFAFPDASIHLRTDRHIDPHGRQLWIDAGGYRLTALKGGRTKISLWTRYQAATPVNAYAAIWGELILGDIQGNILAVVAGRLTGKQGGK